LTTMAAFVMCSACHAEYHDPANRRFHAQPNACPRCGPTVQFLAPGQAAVSGPEAIERARAALAAGAVVAAQGVGGFHLACHATHGAAVGELRRRKQRTDKPFAVLFADLEAARRCALIGEEEARLLQGRQRPIVLVRRRTDPAVPLSPLVAHGIDTVGAL